MHKQISSLLGFKVRRRQFQIFFKIVSLKI